MNGEGWISVERWGEFQHYTDRNPVWIKLYTSLMRSDEYLELTGEQRAILCGLWLEYASSSAQLRADTRSLSYRLRLRVTSRQLEVLNHAGFITIVASKELANGYQDASARRTREEAYREEENPSLGEDVVRPLQQPPASTSEIDTNSTKPEAEELEEQGKPSFVPALPSWEPRPF